MHGSSVGRFGPAMSRSLGSVTAQEPCCQVACCAVCGGARRRDLVRVREWTQSPAPFTVSPTGLARCACRAAAGCSADPPAPLRALVVASAFHSTVLTYRHSHLGCSGRCAPRRRCRRCLHPAGCRGPPSGCPAWRPGGCGAAPGGARRRRRRCTRGWTRLRTRMALPGRAPHVSSVSLHV